jgi:hypothetical protein
MARQSRAAPLNPESRYPVWKAAAVKALPHFASIMPATTLQSIWGKRMETSAMRPILAVLVLAISVVAPRPSQAETTYPWCAQYAREARTCGFTSYGQCRAALDGNTGFCIENPMYRPAERAPPARRYRR